jgi:hypothetical protein
MHAGRTGMSVFAAAVTALPPRLLRAGQQRGPARTDQLLDGLGSVWRNRVTELLHRPSRSRRRTRPSTSIRQRTAAQPDTPERFFQDERFGERRRPIVSESARSDIGRRGRPGDVMSLNFFRATSPVVTPLRRRHLWSSLNCAGAWRLGARWWASYKPEVMVWMLGAASGVILGVLVARF